MAVELGKVESMQFGRLKVEIHSDREAAGTAAAQQAATAIRRAAERADLIGVIFATGQSQIDMLRSLTAIPDIPWNRVIGFHMDEYEKLQPQHPASFRGYLRERLTSRVGMKEFHEIDRTAPALTHLSREYAKNLRAADPQLCLLGIGENGHL